VEGEEILAKRPSHASVETRVSHWLAWHVDVKWREREREREFLSIRCNYALIQSNNSDFAEFVNNITFVNYFSDCMLFHDFHHIPHSCLLSQTLTVMESILKYYENI